MRSTLWLNQICYRQSSQVLSTFCQIVFLSIKVVNSSHWPQILFKTAKQCAFHENCTKRSFQVMRSTFWPTRVCERQSSQYGHTGLKFASKQENSALSMKIVQKPRFQVMRSTFWPNRICERQSCQNRHTGLKFSSKRENIALSMKILQNARFRSCAARFGQIAFVSVKVVKIVTLAVLQNGKTVRFSWKLYKTLFSGHAEHVLAKSHFERQSSQNRHTGLKFSSKRENSALFIKIVQNARFRSCAGGFAPIVFLRVKLLKIVTLVTLLFKTETQCAFHENCTKRSFQVMRSTFWPNRIFERQSCQSRHTGLKFSSKRENSALSMKIVQNALFRSWAARYRQIAFVSVKVVKMVTLAWNSLLNGKTVRFSFVSVKVLKIVTLPSNSLQKGKTVRFS